MSLCMFVCLYPINNITAEQIGPKLAVTTYIIDPGPGKVDGIVIVEQLSEKYG